MLLPHIDKEFLYFSQFPFIRNLASYYGLSKALMICEPQLYKNRLFSFCNL